MLQCSSAGSLPPTNISNDLVNSTRLLPHLQMGPSTTTFTLKAEYKLFLYTALLSLTLFFHFSQWYSDVFPFQIFKIVYSVIGIIMHIVAGVNCYDKSTGRTQCRYSFKMQICLSNPSFAFKYWWWCIFIFTSARKVWQTLSLFCVRGILWQQAYQLARWVQQVRSVTAWLMGEAQNLKNNSQTQEPLQVKRWNCCLQYKYNICYLKEPWHMDSFIRGKW